MSKTWEQDIRAREEENRIAFLAGDLATLELPFHLLNRRAGCMFLITHRRSRFTQRATTGFLGVPLA
ncbi:MAG: hypothetical protein ACJ8DC_01680 [Gemmatimonadales bacterium]